MVLGHHTEETGFHVRLSVAPLKLRVGLCLGPDPDGFPRSAERGSIEARSFGRRPSARILFPRSAERGSIEAVLMCGAPISYCVFPRSAERGSIEAILFPQFIAIRILVSTFG